MADHPRLRRAAADAALRLGTSAGASRLISGSMPIHAELESRLAEFKGTEAALLFGSGYLANTGAIAALARRGEVVFSDELNHASIIDGCRLARAETFVYRHARHRAPRVGPATRPAERAALIVTDGVFSMDGDIAPLPELADLARRHRCRLLVDEAHATGCIGPGGRGSVAAAGLTGEVDVIVGTLGKALGGYGAYVCGSPELVDYLVNTARPFIFSTAPPPPAVAAAAAALELLAESPERVERLQANAAALREALRCRGARSRSGPRPRSCRWWSARPTTRWRSASACSQSGVFAQAIRPPTVPPGTCRLRLTAMATHRVAELRQAARLIGEAARDLGLSSRTPPRGGVADPAARGGLRCAASSSPAPAPRSARPSSPPRSPARPARPGRRGRGLQAGRQRPGRYPRGPSLGCAAELPDHALLRLAAGRRRADDEIAPYRYGPPVSPHLAAELAGEQIDPDRLRGAAPRPPRAPTCSSARASAASWSR